MQRKAMEEATLASVPESEGQMQESSSQSEAEQSFDEDDDKSEDVAEEEQADGDIGGYCGGDRKTPSAKSTAAGPESADNKRKINYLVRDTISSAVCVRLRWLLLYDLVNMLALFADTRKLDGEEPGPEAEAAEEAAEPTRKAPAGVPACSPA